LTNLPKLQTFLSKLSPVPSVVLLAGDFLSPSTLSSMDGGRGMVSTMRAAGITHFCLGNLKADLQLPVLKERLQDFRKSAVAFHQYQRA
jgi:2',3'-cyclic-nucleotide 2'-phosphodiesterase (5'-nucleotidase family)